MKPIAIKSVFSRSDLGFETVVEFFAVLRASIDSALVAVLVLMWRRITGPNIRLIGGILLGVLKHSVEG
jgi:hypothetical protein